MRRFVLSAAITAIGNIANQFNDIYRNPLEETEFSYFSLITEVLIDMFSNRKLKAGATHGNTASINSSLNRFIKKL